MPKLVRTWYPGKRPTLQIKLLKHIAIKGQLSQSEAIVEFRCKPSTISGAFKVLVLRKLIIKSKKPPDLGSGIRRRKIYMLSDKGVTAFISENPSPYEFWIAILWYCNLNSKAIDQVAFNKYYNLFIQKLVGDSFPLRSCFFLSDSFDRLFKKWRKQLERDDHISATNAYHRQGSPTHAYKVIECLSQNRAITIERITALTQLTEQDVRKVLNDYSITTGNYYYYIDLYDSVYQSDRSIGVTTDFLNHLVIIPIREEVKEEEAAKHDAKDQKFELSLLGILLTMGTISLRRRQASIWAGVFATGRNGPDGWNNVDYDTKFPLHGGMDPVNAHLYCLLGKLKNYFFLGSAGRQERFVYATTPDLMPNTGLPNEGMPLYLRINDDTPGNGNGEFSCRVMVWRAEIGYSFIRKWGSRGSENGQFNQPYDIAVDMPKGYVYITDIGNSRVQKFDLNGNFIKSIAPGQLAAPTGIAVDRGTGDIYVAEATNNVIKRYSSDGNFILKWGGSQGNANGQFNGLYGSLAVSGLGDVYVADFGNDRIQKFDKNGNFITKWGSTGAGSGKFIHPTGIATDPDENVYVTDGNSLQKFSSSGAPLAWIYRRDPKPPWGVAADFAKNVFETYNYNNKVQKFGPDCSSAIFLWDGPGTGDGQLGNGTIASGLGPHGIDLNRYTGEVYVVDTANNRIQVFGPIFP